MNVRTDLALEAKTLWEQSAGQTTRLSGVRARERERADFTVTEVEILDKQGETALKKPVGRYITVELKSADRDAHRRGAGAAGASALKG